jgi:hypothetical protein
MARRATNGIGDADTRPSRWLYTGEPTGIGEPTDMPVGTHNGLIDQGLPGLDELHQIGGRQVGAEAVVGAAQQGEQVADPVVIEAGGGEIEIGHFFLRLVVRRALRTALLRARR